MDIESISSIAGTNGFRRSECAYICDIQRNFSPAEGLIWYIYLVYTAIIIIPNLFRKTEILLKQRKRYEAVYKVR